MADHTCTEYFWLVFPGLVFSVVSGTTVPPEIDEDASPSSVFCKMETLCLIFCHATSDYPVTYSWTKSGATLDNDDVIVINNAIVVRPRGAQDYGVYVCNASNSFGSTAYNITLLERNKSQHIFRIAVIILSCVIFSLTVVLGLLLWRQRRMLSDRTNASDGSSCNSDEQDNLRTNLKSEPGLDMKLCPRISDGQSRGPTEYQGLQDNNEPKGYYNLDFKRNRKVKDEEGFDPIGGSWV